MAVYFVTAAPAALLKAFDDRIAQTEAKGKITTWQKSPDGKFYTHKAEDWKAKAWFQATVDQGRLRFNIIRPKDKNVAVEVYGYYHGHLIETFLNHFDRDFSEGTVTSMPANGDNVSGA